MGPYYESCSFSRRSFLKEMTKRYNILEIAPLNKPVGLNGYSPIEKVLLGVAEELPKLEGRKIKTYILCANGSNVQNAIETVDAFGSWHGTNDRIFKNRYRKHFEAINFIPGIDIIHNHTVEFPEYLMSHEVNLPVVNTVHISYETEKVDHFNKKGSFYVAISESHKRELEKKGIEVARVVYNGVDIEEIPFKIKKENYVLSLGRIAKDKGQDIAIEAAKKADQKIVVVGPVQSKKADLDYFETQIKPKIELELDFEKNPYEGMKTIINTEKKVIYCPEVSSSKYELYINAKAFVFPIQWEEPFGLVMIESLASGTPVLAYDRGSVPEIIEDGKNGFIVERDDINGLVNRIRSVDKINPINCRIRAMYFSKRKMAEDYASFFEEVLENY